VFWNAGHNFGRGPSKDHFRTKFWWNSHWMVLFQKCVRRFGPSIKMAPTAELSWIALRFYASGSCLQVIGDTLGYNKGTVSRVVDNVTNALIARKDQFIKWPTDSHTQNKIRYGFFQQANFPNVLGCIDGTHVRIQRPSEDEGSYINRKSYPSINVQAVCDHEGNYLDYKTLFIAFFFSVLSVRTFVYVDYLPLIFSVCVNSTLYQFVPSTILFYLL
jgi:hypothetical protein